MSDKIKIVYGAEEGYLSTGSGGVVAQAPLVPSSDACEPVVVELLAPQDELAIREDVEASPSASGEAMEIEDETLFKEFKKKAEANDWPLLKGVEVSRWSPSNSDTCTDEASSSCNEHKRKIKEKPKIIKDVILDDNEDLRHKYHKRIGSIIRCIALSIQAVQARATKMNKYIDKNGNIENLGQEFKKLWDEIPQKLTGLITLSQTAKIIVTNEEQRYKEEQAKQLNTKTCNIKKTCNIGTSTEPLPDVSLFKIPKSKSPILGIKKPLMETSDTTDENESTGVKRKKMNKHSNSDSSSAEDKNSKIKTLPKRKKESHLEPNTSCYESSVCTENSMDEETLENESSSSDDLITKMLELIKNKTDSRKKKKEKNKEKISRPKAEVVKKREHANIKSSNKYTDRDIKNRTDSEWTTITKRKRKKDADKMEDAKNIPSKSTTRDIKSSKSKVTNTKSRRPKWTIPRPDVIVIKTSDENIFKNTYAKVCKISNSAEIIKRARKTRTGDLLLEMVDNENIDSVKSKLNSLIDTKNIKVIQKMFNIEIKDLDPLVDKLMIIRSIKENYFIPIEDINLRVLRTTKIGLQFAVVEIPLKYLKTIMNKNKIKIGMTYVTCTPAPVIIKCFKCYGLGHHSTNCKEKINIKCRNCCKEGHTQKECKAQPECDICVQENNNAGHLIATMSCPFFRNRVRELKNNFLKYCAASST